jgi:hypothetical protein
MPLYMPDVGYNCLRANSISYCVGAYSFVCALLLDSMDGVYISLMIKADDLIKQLNALCEVDSKALQSLIKLRVPCNEVMAKHPTVQVDGNNVNGYTVSLLGIINGLVEDDGIVAMILEDGVIKGFCRYTGPAGE